MTDRIGLVLNGHEAQMPKTMNIRVFDRSKKLVRKLCRGDDESEGNRAISNTLWKLCSTPEQIDSHEIHHVSS